MSGLADLGSEHVLVSSPVDGVALVTLHRPEVFNALTFAMFDELTATCRALGAIPTCASWS